MDPKYRKKIEEAAAQEQERRSRQGPERPTHVPNMERMPFGCILWVVALVAGIIYMFRGCA